MFPLVVLAGVWADVLFERVFRRTAVELISGPHSRCDNDIVGAAVYCAGLPYQGKEYKGPSNAGLCRHRAGDADRPGRILYGDRRGKEWSNDGGARDRSNVVHDRADVRPVDVHHPLWCRDLLPKTGGKP